MSFSMPYTYMNGKELKALLQSTSKPPPRVIDVRDDDYIGGHIAGSINSPSSTFMTDVYLLVEKLKDEPLVVFHCALSQSRGPKAARIYAETRAKVLPNGPEQKVVVLRGGFTQFQAEFRKDQTLFEDFRPEIWDR